MERKEDILESVGKNKEREDIKEIIKAALTEYEKENNKKQKKRIFANTKKLMEHYLELKAHIKNSKTNINEVDIIEKTEEEEKEEEENLQYDIDMGRISDDVYIESIKRTRTRTLIMIANIDAALMELKESEKKKGTYERYMALEKRYIENKKMSEIEEELCCGHATVSRWINAMLTELGILIFGIDGLGGKIL